MFDPVPGPSGLRDRELRGSSLQRLIPSSVAPYVWPEDRIIPIRRDDHRIIDSRHRQTQYEIPIPPSIPPPQRQFLSYDPSNATINATIKLRGLASSPSFHGQDRPLSQVDSLQGEDPRYVSFAEMMPRSPSHSSQHSDISIRSGDVFRTPSIGSAGGRDDRSLDMGASSEPGPGGSSTLQRPKRSRVLMTHTQQQRLNLLWKRVSSAACTRRLAY